MYFGPLWWFIKMTLCNDPGIVAIKKFSDVGTAV